MSPFPRCLIVVFSALGLAVSLAPPLPAQVEQHMPAASDDALPDGALARHGTVRLRHKGEVGSLAFTPDGKSLLSFGGDQTYRKWDVATGKEQWRYEKKGQLMMSLTPPTLRDDIQFAVRGWAGGQRVMFQRGAFNNFQGVMPYMRIAHNGDGALLAVLDPNDTAVIVNAATDKQILKMKHKGQGCTILSFA